MQAQTPTQYPTSTLTSSGTEKPPSNQAGYNRVAGIILLVLQVLFMFIYGFLGQIRNKTIQELVINAIYGSYFIFTSVFVVLGFGMVFAYFKNNIATGFFTSLFIVSFTMILSPLLQNFWNNTFVSGFQKTNTVTNLIVQLNQAGRSFVYVGFYTLKLAMLNTIAQLVMFTGLIGRVSALQTVIISTIFNIIWNLNHFLCVTVFTNSPNKSIFDDYQISNVYLFGACFGIVLSLFLPKEVKLNPSFSFRKVTGPIALIGTFFIYLSFCVSTSLFVQKLGQFILVWPHAFFNQFMALNASVLTTYATSIIVNGKIGMREALLGTISGGILYGSIANVNGNIGAAIAIGTLAGIISALWYRFVFPSINGLNTIRDSMGMFGLGIISFLGTFFVAPIVIIALYNNQPPLLNIEVVSNPNSAGWVLSYVGISAAIGFVGGLIAYLFSLLGRGEANGKEYEDQRVFSNDFGLDPHGGHQKSYAEVQLQTSIQMAKHY